MHYITIQSFIELQCLTYDKFRPFLVGPPQGVYINIGTKSSL